MMHTSCSALSYTICRCVSEACGVCLRVLSNNSPTVTPSHFLCIDLRAASPQLPNCKLECSRGSWPLPVAVCASATAARRRQSSGSSPRCEPSTGSDGLLCTEGAHHRGNQHLLILPRTNCCFVLLSPSCAQETQPLYETHLSTRKC